MNSRKNACFKGLQPGKAQTSYSALQTHLQLNTKDVETTSMVLSKQPTQNLFITLQMFRLICVLVCICFNRYSHKEIKIITSFTDISGPFWRTETTISTNCVRAGAAMKTWIGCTALIKIWKKMDMS